MYIKNVTHGREKVESILQTTLKGNQQTSVIHSLTHSHSGPRSWMTRRRRFGLHS
jgi:hypothetical protein